MMTADTQQIHVGARSATPAVEQRELDVRAPFRHSAGRLGSHFLQALRARRLLGLKVAGRVIVPPREFGPGGEWVELGPGARLEAYAPADWVPTAGENSCLALVVVDGADSSLLARLRPAATAGALVPGSRLLLRFVDEPRGSMTDFWFEPVGA
jgi:uncharacterized OB-fold protein